MNSKNPNSRYKYSMRTVNPSYIGLFVYICFIMAKTLIPGTEGSTKRPHIVFFLADDLGWNDVSFHGSLQIPTPNIDTLAVNGVVLNNYYVQHLCTPSRAALLTGRHPIHLGMQHHVLRPTQMAGLPLQVKLLPEYLRELGYATHAVGKWHLGFHTKEYTPIYRGFDSFFGTWLPYIDYFDHTYGSIYENLPQQIQWGRAFYDGMQLTSKYMGKYATEVLTDRAVDIIKKHNVSQPLFLYMAQVAVHRGNWYQQFQAPMREIAKMAHIKNANRQAFAGMVAALDKSVGQVFAALAKQGMLEDVVFVFSSDNGGEGPVESDGMTSMGSNWPLRGNKGTLWEAGIRGVGLIWSRLLKKTNRISNQMMHIADWLPTLYRVSGGDVEELGDIYGHDLWDSLSYSLPSQREEILHNIDPIEKASALRIGKYKIVVGSHFKGLNNEWYGLPGRDNEISYSSYMKKLRKCSAWKVLKTYGWVNEVTDQWGSQLDIRCKWSGYKNENDICDPDIKPCLFNVEEDPCEQRNLAHQHPEILNAMLNRLEEYNRTAVPLVNRTHDPRADPLLHHFQWTNWAQDL